MRLAAQMHCDLASSNVLLTRRGARGVCGRLGVGRLRAKVAFSCRILLVSPPLCLHGHPAAAAWEFVPAQVPAMGCPAWSNNDTSKCVSACEPARDVRCLNISKVAPLARLQEPWRAAAHPAQRLGWARSTLRCQLPTARLAGRLQTSGARARCESRVSSWSRGSAARWRTRRRRCWSAAS